MSKSIKYGINITRGNLITTNIVSTSFSTGAIHASDITSGNINFTGNLYQNGALYVAGTGGGVSSQWTSTNGNIYYTTTAGNAFVGINTSTPTSALDVSGGVRITGSLTTGSILSTGTISAGGVSATNVSATNLRSTNITASNLLSTSMSTSNLSAGNINSTAVTSSGLVSTNLSAGTLSVTNVNATAMTSSSVNSTNATASNLVATSTTTDTLNASGGVTTSNLLINTIANQSVMLADLGTAGSWAIGANNNAMQYQVGAGASGSHVFYTNSTTGSSNEAMGTERMRITATGNVGIGESLPSDKLHVAGNLRVSGLITTANMAATNATFGNLVASSGATLGNLNVTALTSSNLVATAAVSTGSLNATNVNVTAVTTSNLVATGATVGALNSTNAVVTSVTASNMVVGTSATVGSLSVSNVNVTSMTSTNVVATNITSGLVYLTDNLQIPNTQQMSFLKNDNTVSGYVKGDSLFEGIVLGRNNGGIITEMVVGGSDSVNLKTNNTSRLFINTAGNVGIGTETPSKTLHVSGDMLVSGLVTASNMIATSVTAAGLVSTAITSGGLAVSGEVKAASITTGNVDASGDVRVKGDVFVNGSLTAVNITSLNLIQTNISSGALNVSGMSTLQDATVTNITVADLRVTNSYATSVSSANASALNATIGNVVASNLLGTTATLPNLVATNISTGDLRSTNSYATNMYASSLISTANMATSTISAGNVVVSGGNFGYNVTPQRQFHMRGGTFRTDNGDIMLSRLSSDYTTVYKTFSINVDGTAACTGNFTITDNGNNVDGSGKVTRFIINSHGNVGIGGITTGINNSLHVSGSSLISEFITTPNVIATNVTAADLRATNAYATTLVSSNLITTTNLQATSATIGGLMSTISNLNSTNISATNLIASNSATIGTLSITNMSNTAITTTNLIVTGNSNTIGSIVTTGGNLGMGIVPNSLYRLHISGSATAGNGSSFGGPNDGLKISHNNTVGNAVIQFNNSFNNPWEVGTANSGSSFGNLRGAFYVYNQSGGSLFVGKTNGNWGINTDSPTNTLHVAGDLRVHHLITVPNIITTNVTATSLLSADVRATSKYLFGYTNTGGVWITENWGGAYVGLDTHPFRVYNASLAVGYTSGSYSWGTNGNTMIAGNVGIGTSAPGYKLDVLQTTNVDTARVRNTNNAGYASIRCENDTLTWIHGVGGSATTNFKNQYYIVNGTTTFVGSSNGNWGINTTSASSTLQINGSLAKSSGTFDIKHPILPGKRLVHSFIEGPRCDLIYRGRKQLVGGQAVVDINLECTHNTAGSMSPGTFEALCANPQAFISCNTSFEKVIGTVSGATLTIQSNNANSNSVVDWIVIAERKDQFIKEWNKTDQDGYLVTEHDEVV